jgi:hypothetical protein
MADWELAVNGEECVVSHNFFSSGKPYPIEEVNIRVNS